MLGRRHRRRPNISPTLGGCVVFAGKVLIVLLESFYTTLEPIILQAELL